MRLPLAVLSWLFGLADYVYYFLRPRIATKRKFFNEGYGDVAFLRDLHGHVAGAFVLVQCFNSGHAHKRAFLQVSQHNA